MHDVVFSLMLLGFLRKSVDNRFLLAVDWSRVGSHMEKTEGALKTGARINLNPDALRWTPGGNSHDLYRPPSHRPPQEGKPQRRKLKKNQVCAQTNKKNVNIKKIIS